MTAFGEAAAADMLLGSGSMRLELSARQREERLRFRSFVQTHIAPHAAEWDRSERISTDIIDKLRSLGFLGAPLARQQSPAMDAITYGLLTEEIARGCSSVRSLLTVHDMVAQGIWRWGGRDLKAEFGEGVATGRCLCALALSEPDVGSDAAGVVTEARPDGGTFVLSGEKKWITFGQIADLFLVLARCSEGLGAFLVPAATPGLERRPITGIVGTRASQLASITLRACRVPRHYLLGKAGFGLSHVVSSVLDFGRYSVAWGSVGIAQACLDACLDYTRKRRQFGVELREHQLVQRMLTEIIANTRASRLLCYRAGYLRSVDDTNAMAEALVAKYFASRTAVYAANAAVHLHGANGLTDEYPVARYLRDAKVMEIIEGSSEIQQIMIAKYPLGDL
jgi:glutaryl-CoA dehydrogenase (non-decarboxylating)